MRHCKGCNRFVPTDAPCDRCAARTIADAERMPYRLEQPQAHDRCHRCWNLDPVCRCNGWLYGVNPDPDLSNLLEV